MRVKSSKWMSSLVHGHLEKAGGLSQQNMHVVMSSLSSMVECSVIPLKWKSCRGRARKTDLVRCHSFATSVSVKLLVRRSLKRQRGECLRRQFDTSKAAVYPPEICQPVSGTMKLSLQLNKCAILMHSALFSSLNLSKLGVSNALSL
ncbi:hypothetical protein TGME49_221275 [Toxoplasma gondii ME49]|uniref:Uncharacterized protein n=2 Tax=Toxoplasma gondii TaxID=5811 RepID=S8GTS2_TOXGM|nr:hypothetical protein TGME49_221275 [Toxoplasma gondii ME49]EPT31964.1 hypothetical protein TGME49_221275 [Toxoplasma gondii ME49]KYF42707.1 hypothetical protein TGARI_221275 [Toxoplasma gondii ARI]|eukprot:XP_018638256.1 hypothetical protein TGME49_221275 [Toxoplasma gondii ME49]